MRRLLLVFLIIMLSFSTAEALRFDQNTEFQPNISTTGHYALSNPFITLDELIVNSTHATFIGLDPSYQGAYNTDTLETLCSVSANCSLNQTNAAVNVTFGTPDQSPPNITYVDPTPFNETTVTATDDVTINVTLNETGDACLLEWNYTTNYSMSGSGTNFWQSFTDLANGTYNYVAWCNDTSGNLGWLMWMFDLRYSIPAAPFISSCTPSPMLIFEENEIIIGWSLDC